MVCTLSLIECFACLTKRTLNHIDGVRIDKNEASADLASHRSKQTIKEIEYRKKNTRNQLKKQSDDENISNCKYLFH